MKRPYRYLLNLLSFALLLFAVYLNFVKKETADVSVPTQTNNASTEKTSAIKQTSSAEVTAKTFALK